MQAVMMREPLMTVPQLMRKWEALGEHKPIPVSERTIYRLISEGRLRCHGFGSPLVRESEVIEDFEKSQFKRIRLVYGNTQMGPKKKEMVSELERRIKDSSQETQKILQERAPSHSGGFTKKDGGV